MGELTTLLDRNRSFAEKFETGDLPIRPRMSTFILTCIDSRVDPAHLTRPLRPLLTMCWRALPRPHRAPRPLAK